MPAHLHRAVRAALLSVAIGIVAGPWASVAFARKPRGFGGDPPQAKPKRGKVVEAEVVAAGGGAAARRADAAPEEDALGPEAALATGPRSAGLVGQTSPLQAVIVGGGAAGLWLALLLAAMLPGRARVRVYEPRWERSDEGALRWDAATQESPYRSQVATIPGRVWSELPREVQELVFPPDGFVEQWPSSKEDGEGTSEPGGGTFPRSVVLASLEDGLLDAVQYPLYADAIELFASVYDGPEHARLGKVDPFHVIVAADGEAAVKAGDDVFGAGFGRVLPGPSYQSLAETLAVAFDLDVARESGVDVEQVPLSIAASTVVSRAQRRYLVSWTDRSHGTLHMRLTMREADELAEAQAGLHGNPPRAGSLPWLREGAGKLRTRVLQGLALFGIPEEAVLRADRRSCDGVVRPSFLGPVPDLQSPAAKAPLAFLMGDAAWASPAHFGPGFGPGAALEGARSLAQTLAGGERGSWWLDEWPAPLALANHAAMMASLRDRGRQSASVGVEQCIEIGLKKAEDEGPGGADADREAFLESVRSTLERLQSERLPPERAAELPTWEALREEVLAADLAPETFSVLASTGPWLPEADGVVEKTTPEVDEGPGVFDFGGETPEGKAQAKQLATAAGAGDPEAQFQLGVMHFTANGVKKDGPLALKWLTRSAEAGHLQAQNCAGSILRNGVEGLPVDKKQAAHWFRQAAERGEKEAQYNLAEMYEEADGIENDEEEAFKWYYKAAEAGLPLAQFKAGLMLHAGNGVDKKDVVRSIPLLTRAAEQGVLQAMNTLGNLYYMGDGVVQDKAKAVKYFEEAAEAGNPLAQYSLGLLLELGDGVEKDLEGSQRWLRQAAAQGVVEAQARCRSDRLLAEPKGDR